VATVRIYNSAGELVSTLYDALALYQAVTGIDTAATAFVPDQGGQGVVDLVGSGISFAWNGTNAAGQLVASGAYTVAVELHDSFGKTQNWSVSLAVLRAETGAVVEVYNGAGELVWRAQGTLQAGGALALSGRELVPEAGTGGLKISYGSGSSDFVIWDGKGGQGQALSSGSYLIKVTQSDHNGKTTYTDTVALIQPNVNVFGWAAAAPNPVRSGSGSVLVSLQGGATGLSVWGEVYNLAGEHVATLSEEPGASLRWSIKPGIASGVYLLQVNARDAQGRSKSSIVKVSVLW
jgi:hypothetical protein